MTLLIKSKYHQISGNGETFGDKLAEEAGSRASREQAIHDLRQESQPSTQEQLETAAKENRGLDGYEDPNYCETCGCSPCNESH
jgi:hypothetical protein